ncbi:MAG: oligosaccharide flippase family protein [Pseudomonadota bacterium]|nr:oligosaccharide flippase family protein [Pseudomonadota bacterium]
MDDHRRHLIRGFNWLGSAAILARIIDFSTILAVLLFLTKEQVGIASLVVSFGMVVEAFNGLGTSEALVQTPSVNRLQLDTLFWFVLAAGALAGVLTLLAAPWIATVYGVSGMAVYFLAIAIKQPIVAAAVIPLAILNRDLQYERIAVVSVCATAIAALTRLGLAVAGAGAWAIVAGYAVSGLCTLIGAFLAKPFRPGLRFRMPAISPLLHFGLRAATSNIFEQVFKNVDYLLIGWFYGAAPLAVYRVAFDVAMEPAMAVGTLVNRTALPVFAKLASARDALAQALTWSLGRLSILVFPLMAGLILAADPLTSLLHDGQGRSYAAAALPLKLLAAAALLRVTSQLLYPLMMGSGRPGAAARLSATTLALLTIGILVAGFSFRAGDGIIAMAGVWFAVYPLLLVWAIRYVWRNWRIRAFELARALILPGGGIATLVLMVMIARLLPLSSDPRVELGLVIGATALTYGGLFFLARRRPEPAA